MSHLNNDLKTGGSRHFGHASNVSQAIAAAGFMPRKIFYRLLVSAIVGVVAVYVWRRR